jgi:hypothetical protein
MIDYRTNCPDYDAAAQECRRGHTRAGRAFCAVVCRGTLPRSASSAVGSIPAPASVLFPCPGIPSFTSGAAERSAQQAIPPFPPAPSAVSPGPVPGAAPSASLPAISRGAVSPGPVSGAAPSASLPAISRGSVSPGPVPGAAPSASLPAVPPHVTYCPRFLFPTGPSACLVCIAARQPDPTDPELAPWFLQSLSDLRMSAGIAICPHRQDTGRTELRRCCGHREPRPVPIYQCTLTGNPAQCAQCPLRPQPITRPSPSRPFRSPHAPSPNLQETVPTHPTP